MRLSADEFLRRFTQHVLPKRFVKIRHCGPPANRQREERLRLCRELLGEPGEPDALTTISPTVLPAGEAHCPNCGGSRLVCRALPRERPSGSAVVHGIDSG